MVVAGSALDDGRAEPEGTAKFDERRGIDSGSKDGADEDDRLSKRVG